MLIMVLCVAIVLAASAYTWAQDAKAGVNR